MFTNKWCMIKHPSPYARIHVCEVGTPFLGNDVLSTGICIFFQNGTKSNKKNDAVLTLCKHGTKLHLHVK